MGFEDVPLRLLDDIGIAGILAKPLDELRCVGPCEAVAFLFGAIGRPKAADWHESAIHGRTARDQRPPRPPEVKRRDMPLPDGLLPRRLGADRLDREVIFNQPAILCPHYLTR